MAGKNERSPEQDLRQVGAMLLILRRNERGGMEAWVMADESKCEEAAGTHWAGFTRKIEQRLNVPAGGRNGYETPQRTLREETLEEAGIQLPPEMEFFQIHPWYFLADQKKDEVKRLAVGVWGIRVQQGDELEQVLSRSDKGKWMPLAELRRASRDEKDAELYRPQLLAAAAIASGLCDVETIKQANALFLQTSETWAEEKEQEICPGVVDGEGNITAAEALIFLGMEEKSATIHDYCPSNGSVILMDELI